MDDVNNSRDRALKFKRWKFIRIVHCLIIQHQSPNQTSQRSCGNLKPWIRFAMDQKVFEGLILNDIIQVRLQFSSISFGGACQDHYSGALVNAIRLK